MKRLGTLALLLFACGSVIELCAQSTYGSIVGTVKDSSGASVQNAAVTVTNVDENTTRNVLSNSSGDYSVPNLLAGHYKVDVTAKGFQSFSATDLMLVARQLLRVDAGLTVGSTQQTVTVNAEEAGIIQTDSQVISATFTPEQLLDLPSNVRANGNTSPYRMLEVLPGVQADRDGNYGVQGALPSMTDISVDGISTVDVTGNSPLTNAFPSQESIAEIKVQGVGSNAEFGQEGNITTVSKSGTNQLHGDLFWYAQNAALDSVPYGSNTKPKKVANDFGASLGGPVVIPKLYNGHDKTFFFATYEGFRLPQSETIQNQVPTSQMRNGDFSQEGVSIIDPLTGNMFANDQIPASRISPVASKLLSLYPLPNTGDLNSSHANNWNVNKSNNYSSNQYDIRIDQVLTAKQSIFGRWTWQNIDQVSPQSLLVPTETTPENNKLLTLAHNYAILPELYNEARFGFTLNTRTQSLPFDGVAFTNSLGLVGIGPSFPFNGIPDVNIAGGFTGVNTDRGNSKSQANTWSFADNLTWSKGKHTFKFGFDWRHIRAVTPLGFLGGDNYGSYSFSGTYSGNGFADFLLGIPANTAVDNVQHDNDGRSDHYAAYAQDSWKITDRLTLEYGVRFEYNPGYTDAFGDIGNFDPRVAKSGAVIYPNGAASLLAAPFLASFNACPAPAANGAPCTPVLSASQAGLNNTLRTAPRRFMPRFGFRLEAFWDDKTVIRAGFNIYDVTVLGSIYYALTGTLQSNTRTYNNAFVMGSR